MIRAMSTELFLNFLAIKMDSRRAEGLEFIMNLVTPDNGERFVVELSNATLTNIAGLPGRGRRPDADGEPRRPRDGDGGQCNARGAAGRRARRQAEGDLAILAQLAGLMVEFDPRFEIMPGTKLRTELPEMEPFVGDVGAVIPE